MYKQEKKGKAWIYFIIIALIFIFILFGTNMVGITVLEPTKNLTLNLTLI